jgi:protocatechuate 3,4-dioxygenase beta subunit
MRVQLSGVMLSMPPRVLEAATDADGRYELTDVPPGEYHASAGPDQFGAGYQSKTFGSEINGALPLRPGLPLKPGERRADVDFALARTYAVEGRVTNDFGEPLADLAVLSERIDGSGSTRPTTTDDRGHFRLYGLVPGSWRVCAKASNREGPTVGEHPLQLVRTCHPGDTAAKGAAIEIRNADVTGIAIQMQRERAYTVSGAVVDGSGAPVDGASVEVRRVERDNFRFGPTIAETRRSAFVARGLTPGDYVVHAIVAEPPNREGRPSGYPVQQGFSPLRIDATDVSGVVLTVSRGADVAGRVVFDGEPAPPPRGLQMRIGAHHAGDAAQMYSGVNRPASATVREDLGFALTGAYGPLILDVIGAPPGWVVKSMRYGDAEIAGVATEFSPGPRSPGVEIVLTNRIGRLTIRPVDEQGRPAAALVFLMPADAARWRSGATFALVPRADGTPAPVARLPGEYVILALGRDDATRGMRNVDELKAAAGGAMRITLKEGEERTVDVRVTTLPRER